MWLKSRKINGAIKQRPEDFVVNEMFPKQPTGSGDYTWFTLKKTDWETHAALWAIARRLGISVKRFGYAGTKDKAAVTTQRVSAWRVEPEKLAAVRIRDMELSDFEKADARITLGELEGNDFEVTIRDVKTKKSAAERVLADLSAEIKKRGIPNYFGPQRFGSRGNNHRVGRKIIKGDIKGAAWLFLAGSGDRREDAKNARLALKKDRDFKAALSYFPAHLKWERMMLEHLASQPNDYAGALRLLPKKLRWMFVHAYQSHIWNACLKKYLGVATENAKIPVIGYDTVLEGPMGGMCLEVLSKERVKPADFRPARMPELYCAGMERDALIYPELSWGVEDDELNAGKRKAVIKFRLPPGAYATVLLKEIGIKHIIIQD